MENDKKELDELIKGFQPQHSINLNEISTMASDYQDLKRAAIRKRDALVAYNEFLTYLDSLKIEDAQLPEKEARQLQLLSEEIYLSQKDFILTLDKIEGTNYWEKLKKD